MRLMTETSRYPKPRVSVAYMSTKHTERPRTETARPEARS
jgi:hypothetical protein